VVGVVVYIVGFGFGLVVGEAGVFDGGCVGCACGAYEHEVACCAGYLVLVYFWCGVGV